MQTRITWIIAVAAVLAGAAFIVTGFRNSSEPPAVAPPPDLTAAPVRLYGTIEPAGREVFVSPPLTRRVTALYVTEGDTVRAGQRLCDLESSVEAEEVELARARVALSQKSLELDIDELRRTKDLYAKRVDSEYKYTQALIKKELEMKRLQVAKHELQLAKSRFEQTVLRAPVEGLVYKCDVRVGETLSAGDNTRIVLGSPDLWVRLSVESFWRKRVQPGQRWNVSDSETGQLLGTGTVIRQLPWMGRRDFRTEDLQERFDTKFQQVILELYPATSPIPLGLSVRAWRDTPDNGTRAPN